MEGRDGLDTPNSSYDDMSSKWQKGHFALSREVIENKGRGNGFVALQSREVIENKGS